MSVSVFDSENQFNNIIKSVQYIMRLTLQQDIYDNITQVIAKYFKAAWVTFASFNQQDNKYVYYGMTPQGGFQENFDMDAIEKIVLSVLDNGFLALESFSVPQPAQLVFLPLREHENIKMVLVVGHKDEEKLPKNLINTYLALAELSSTAIDLRRHRIGLEEIIFERTKELESANKLLKQINEKNIKELIVANTFQTSLMPSLKQFDTADMFGKYIPCSMVGGDLYDCVASGDSLWFIIADVAGHGLVASMISTMVKGMFNECIRASVYPSEVLENMNHILCKMQDNTDSYLISAFIGVIRGNDLLYSNAGHPYPIIIDCENNSSRVIQQNGYLLGIECDTKYCDALVNMNKGEIILLYTDGFINPRNEDLDLEKKVSEYSLKECNLLMKDPQTFIENLVDSLCAGHGINFEDDASIMVVRKK